jgi:CRP/FNR family transcriptional regulator, cyclic AMP receptor protein
MRTIEELLSENATLAALTPEHRAVIAGCAENRVFDPGEYAMREGDPADVFYVLRHGDVALETFAPQRGPMTLETLHDGDLLGWSWLIPPYRTMFDARSLGTTHAIAFDGACLRGKLEQDPALGYAIMRLFSAVIVERLQNTRLRLLDLYGTVPGEPVPPA